MFTGSRYHQEIVKIMTESKHQQRNVKMQDGYYI